MSFVPLSADDLRAETGPMSDDNTMNAVRQHTLGGPETLSVERIERPVPVPTEVLVRVRAAGVNPVDWMTREGRGMAGVLGAPPFILGWDVAGVVEEVGFGVTTLAPGDEVYGMPWFPRAAGAYAEYVTAPSRHFTRKPSSATFEEAAAVPLAGLTAWQALVDTAGLRPGQRVLITAAAGGVGHLAVQFAKHLGAHVIAVAGPRNQQWLTELGADEVVDYTAGRFEKEVGDVDVVLDLVGDAHDATSTRSIETLRPGGLLIAVPAGVSPELAAAAAAAGVRVTAFLVEPDGLALARIAELIDAGTVKVEVAGVRPLAEVAEAHREAEGRHTRGKVVLKVEQPAEFAAAAAAVRVY
jgi:NADPH:quinone reductase-like Zn-dependent oxidoreductase